MGTEMVADCHLHSLVDAAPLRSGRTEVVQSIKL